MTIQQIDWNDVWQAKAAAARQAMGNSDCARSWDNRESARNYWRMVLDAVDGLGHGKINGANAVALLFYPE